MSLATNLAVADALHAAGTGLFRGCPTCPSGRSSGCASRRRRSPSTGPGTCRWPVSSGRCPRAINAAQPSSRRSSRQRRSDVPALHRR
jgi:hypothetical protein